MIEDNTTWYLGTVGSGTSYKLANIQILICQDMLKVQMLKLAYSV